MALNPLALQHAMNPKPIQSRLLNDDDLEGLSGPRKRFLLELIFVSLELSRSTWLITSLSPGGGEKMSKQGLSAGNIAALLARLSEAPRLVRIAVGSAKWG